MARKFKKDAEGFPIFGYYDADHFLSCWNAKDFDPDRFYNGLISRLDKVCPNYFFSLSIGIVKVDDPWLDISVCCDRARIAQKSLEGDHHQHWAYYDRSMHRSIREEGELAQKMRKALKNGEFIPFFQPQINYVTGEIIGAEALVRWRNEEGNLIPPSGFVPVFERNGFIYEMDQAIWRAVCACIRRWKDQGIRVPPISVNISRRDIYHTDLSSVLLALVKEFVLTARDLRLEVTESAYMENPALLESTLQALSDAEFIIEMDDFGSGYSSLTALKDLPFRLVKLDMGFLRSGLDKDKDARLLRAVIRLANDIDLPVIAEGVETRKQADFLQELGCRLMQGYHFAKPMPMEEFETYLTEPTILKK